MANHRPKSLSELNNVYDKAMRAERAIKEGSSLLSVPETKEIPQSENIFEQLETKAAQAEKNQVFDPDITNIANDFLKRYAQTEKPKAAPKEIKRPAPSIQSVYHSAVKPEQEYKQDVSLKMGDSPAISFDAPAVPLHKPSPTMPEAKPEPVAAELPAEPVQEAPAVVTAPKTAATETKPVADIPADTDENPTSDTPAVKTAPRPVRKSPARVRITSTERNELMEEYLRVMSDDDDDEAYKKPKFSFFKKKKKHEEEFNEEPMADLYEDLPEEEEADGEVPVVPFDNSNVKYADEYSDAPADEEIALAQEQMNIYDYIEADFDYDDEYPEDDEDALLDVSLAGNISAEAEPEEIVPEEGTYPTEPEEGTYPTEPEEEIIYPEEETSPVEEEAEIPEEAEESVYEEAPTADMIFEDIFSVSDENKRSHTGGNWEEVFGTQTVPTAVESPDEDYSEYTPDSEEEYVEIHEETEQIQYTKEDNAEEAYDAEDHSGKSGFPIKFLTVLIAVICILGAAATLLTSAVLDVNSGNLISEQYRVFSTPTDLIETDLEANTLVITENIYAHVDDIYVFVNEESGAFEFGKVTATVPSLTGDYLYLTESDSGTKAINRDRSMGVVIATYTGIGGFLAAICEYYILIAGALILLAVAMIVCLILFSRKLRKDGYAEEAAETEADADDSDDSDSDDSDSDRDDSEEESEYYSDYDTDGIEQGLFSDI